MEKLELKKLPYKLYWQYYPFNQKIKFLIFSVNHPEELKNQVWSQSPYWVQKRVTIQLTKWN